MSLVFSNRTRINPGEIGFALHGAGTDCTDIPSGFRVKEQPLNPAWVGNSKPLNAYKSIKICENLGPIFQTAKRFTKKDKGR